MTQKHPYNAELAYHFVNLALAAECQPLWEAEDGNHPDLENLFMIPRDYYDRLFLTDEAHNGDALYKDIQGYVDARYEQIGQIRVGLDVVPDYPDAVPETTLDKVQTFGELMAVMQSYSRRINETVVDAVRYSLSNLLMGYALQAKDGGHGIIVVRGTMSTEEWLNNLNYRTVPFHPTDDSYGNVHNGFRDVYKGIRGQYRDLADAFPADKPLYLVGHSLGAAVSQLGALDLALRHPERAERLQVYAFAPPRTGNLTFAAAYDRLVPTSYRVVNVCDVVPYVPFNSLGEYIDQPVYPYADTKGEMAYVHQMGNPIANHVSSYHHATRADAPALLDLSTPRRVSVSPKEA
jgi:hypothetical protein